MATLNQTYPPSEPCSCEACKQFCLRPGWWSVEEAERALRAGNATWTSKKTGTDHGQRLVLEWMQLVGIKPISY